MWVGVEATLVADGGATLGALVEVGYVVSGGELGGVADGAQLAAGHGRDLWHGVR